MKLQTTLSDKDHTLVLEVKTKHGTFVVNCDFDNENEDVGVSVQKMTQGRLGNAEFLDSLSHNHSRCLPYESGVVYWLFPSMKSNEN